MQWQRDVCMMICMLDWKQKKVKRSCTDWLGRKKAGKDVQHVRVIKDENGNVMVNSKAVLKRWKEYFEKLMNEENNREPRTEKPEMVKEEVKACFHYKRGKKHSLFVLLIFFCARFNFNRSLQSKINKRDKECSFPRL